MLDDLVAECVVDEPTYHWALPVLSKVDDCIFQIKNKLKKESLLVEFANINNIIAKRMALYIFYLSKA